MLAVSGSLDGSSSNTALLRAVTNGSTVADITLFESIEDLPHFRPDHDDDAALGAVHALRAAVRALGEAAAEVLERATQMLGDVAASHAGAK